MRRPFALLVLTAALVSAAPAAAALQPVRRSFGEVTLPLLRHGTVVAPQGHTRGRVTVIVDLQLPPLAAALGARTLQGTRASRHLSVRGSAARSYFARVASEQQAAVATLQRAIPSATVGRRFSILLNGLTVELPAKRLPALARLAAIRRVYPSLRYTLRLNRSPGIIGADELQAATGARGDGIKIGVVDDGVDQTNPFFDPTGFSYPAGFPRGGLRWTSAKVIVARSFPGPGSGRPGRLAVDPRSSFHGTHVAGIAAGDAGTNAPAGRDHPPTAGLSGVAPRAWLGNYRVFTVPTPVGHVANTPEIVAAFESAVSDGMDVINFSGGGPATDPANDALIETVHNVVAAGVVPVIAAGNDRDDFGRGTVGSPGSAPDAITVAAVSNSQVFAPALKVVAPGSPDVLGQIPFESQDAPPAWASIDQPLVDVGGITGADGAPVERHLCGRTDVNAGGSTLPPGSLSGAIVLVSRGTCTFLSKALRAKAAGAKGLIVVDNRPGEANGIPAQLPLPAGMISDLDGKRLRDFMTGTGGRTTIRAGGEVQRIVTGRGGIVTSFSSAGPTDFGHLLKPDISAPGGSILSSTLPAFAGSPFAVFDGTSMATPHVAGSAALLLQLHHGWSPAQVKSALVSTAGAAYSDTARTIEAPVQLEGGGLVRLPGATDPKLFTEPSSLGFSDLDVNRGARSRALLVRVTDAGDGAGTWNVSLAPQSATAGTTIDLPATVTIAPGGETELAAVVRAAADAAAGDDYGFIVLSRGSDRRRIPYAASVTRPGLELDAPPVKLQRFQVGTTVVGPSRASHYRYPDSPFGPAPDYVGAPTREDGAEKVYTTSVDRPVANVGVAVIARSTGAQIDPFILGSLDENDVQGYAGTPVDVNGLTFDYRIDIGAAAAVFPRQQRFYVAVDAGRDPFTGKILAGRYLLRSWINDVTPPRVRLLTTRVAAGHPTIVVRAIDAGAGVDPLSLVFAYKRILLGATDYDPTSGIAVLTLPPSAPPLRIGSTPATLVASDYQEAKNVNTVGTDIMPNTAFSPTRLRVVDGPAISWILPNSGSCVRGTSRLVVAASSTAQLRSVRFLDGSQSIATVTRAQLGLFATDWRAKGRARGLHTLQALLTDAAGRHASARLVVRTCR